jgi:hypothetical protein
MSRWNSSSVVVAVIALTSVACSGQSPLGPSAAVGSVDGVSAQRSTAPPGSYELSFHVFRNGTLEPVDSLPVLSRELILKAEVKDSSGAPAQTGAVTFESCSFKGLPPNDITRADEAPKEACASGSASWDRLDRRSVDAGTCPGLGVGTACYSFGLVRIPRTVGFRFRFDGNTSIAKGVSAAENFTWVSGV